MTLTDTQPCLAAPGTTAADAAIIGASGRFGGGLAVRLAGAGAALALGSRDAERAAAVARAVADRVPGAQVAGTANAAAAAQAPIVVLCVPFASHAATVAELAPALRPGQVVVDATVPLATAVGSRPTRTVGVWQGSAAEQAQELLPDGVHVVGALHTVSAAALDDLGRDLDQDVLLCGDRRADREAVAALIGRVPGLRPVHAGALEMARIVEPLTALLVSVNRRHRAHAGIRLTGLPS